MHKLQLEPGIFFARTFIFAEDIIAIIFPCRKALKPHLGSASCCVRYCSSRVPAPASLKAKGSSQTEGGKGKRAPGEVGVAQRLRRTRLPQPAPPSYPSEASDPERGCSSYTLSKAQHSFSADGQALLAPNPAAEPHTGEGFTAVRNL